MYGWRGILTGALALVIAQAVLERANAGGDQVGAVLGFVNELATRFIDPKVPAIPARTAAPLAPPAGAVYSGPNASSSTGSGGGFSQGGGAGGGGGGGGGW